MYGDNSVSAKHKAIGRNYRAKSQDTIDNNAENFFPTYHALTRLLLDNIELDKDKTILEPCAGAGDITKVLHEYGYNHVYEMDINPIKENILKHDFLKFKPKTWGFHYVITNPPFKLFNEFLKKSCEVATESIYMIAPLDYLHGVERHKTFYENGCNGFRLKTCYAFVRRPLFGAQYHPAGLMPTGATSFAWFHFENGYNGDPAIKWLHNNSCMGQPTEAEQILMQDVLKHDIMELQNENKI